MQTTGICYALNIPQMTSSSGSGDIFFQLKAPTSFRWVALGQGSEMEDLNIFVMYQSADGKNVTVSPRQTPGEVMPTHDTTTQMELLAGSGIENGMMTANVKCSNCQSWKGQTMNFGSGSSAWSWAYKMGEPLMSDSLSAVIQMHDEHGSISFDNTRAIGGPNSNPFVSAAATAPSSSMGSASGSSSSTAGGIQPQSFRIRITRVHGSLASIAFIALFPLGAILVRWGSFKNIAYIHGGIQLFAYATFISAAGIGLFIATRLDLLMSAHAIIGMILLGTIFFLPFFGTLHHMQYKKLQKRTVVSHGHIWVGRAAILLGMINGGLGLRFFGVREYEIAYGVFAGLMGLIYIASFTLGEARRAKMTTARKGGETDSDRELSRSEPKTNGTAQV